MSVVLDICDSSTVINGDGVRGILCTCQWGSTNVVGNDNCCGTQRLGVCDPVWIRGKDCYSTSCKGSQCEELHCERVTRNGGVKNLELCVMRHCNVAALTSIYVKLAGSSLLNVYGEYGCFRTQHGANIVPSRSICHRAGSK